MNEPVSTIMSSDLITIHPDDRLSTILDLLANHRIHHFPVVRDGRLEGLVTTYDLFKINLKHEEMEQMAVGEVMTRRLAVLEPTAKVGTAAEIFLENLFHALPVVERGKLVGIVTSFDVLKYSYRKEYPNDARFLE